MANGRNKLGKVVEQIGGFRIRMEMEERNNYEMDRFGRKRPVGTSKRCFKGTYGVYAGRNLCKGGLSIEKAREYADSYNGN